MRPVPHVLVAVMAVLTTLVVSSVVSAPVAGAQSPAGASADGARTHVPEFILTPWVPGPSGTTVATPAAPFPTRAAAQAGTGELRATYSAQVPEAAKPAIQSALDRWAAALRITVPVEVAIEWQALGDGSLVGAARPTLGLADFAGAPVPATFYPIALANQIIGFDRAPAVSDIEILLSDRSDWDYAVAGPVSPGRTSLTSVVLHEVLHGLGFSALFDVDAAGVGRRTGSMALPSIFDTLVVDRTGAPVTGLPDNSVTLGRALTQGLFWRGGQGTAANGGAPPVLFSPSPFEAGSSIAHLDEATYPTGHPDSVSTPTIVGNEAIYSIGTIAPAMLADTGWVLEGASTPAVPVPAIPPVGVPGSAPLPVPLPSSGPTEVRPLVSAVSTRVTTSGGSLEVALSAMVASSSPNATIVAVTYAVDGAIPVPMTAVDGAFDAVAEAATAIITGLTGSHSICITATDSTGAVSEPQCTAVSAVSAPIMGVSDPAGLPPASAPASAPLTSTLPRTGFPTAPAAALGAAAVAGGFALVQRSRWSRPVSRPAHAVS